MSYINKDQEASLTKLFQNLCREQKRFSTETSESIVELREIIMDLHNQRRKGNKKTSGYIANKRKHNKDYARPKH